MHALVESLNLSCHTVFPQIVRKEQFVQTFRTGITILPLTLSLSLVFLQTLPKLLLDFCLSGKGGLVIEVKGDKVVFRSLQLGLVDHPK